MLLTGIWQMQYVRKAVAYETQKVASRSMDRAVQVIDNRISNIETALKTAASYAYLFASDKQKANKLMESLIDFNEDIDAVTLLYEANYFPDEGRYYAPTIVRDPDTGKLEFDQIGGSKHDFYYLETDSNWIYTRKLNHGYWCLPYKSISTKQTMVTYSVPLHDKNGHIYAVMCADIGLEWIKEIVEEAKPYEYSQVFVISRDSQYVCHPDNHWIQTINVVTYANQTNDSNFINLTRRMLHGERGIDTLDENNFITNNQQAKHDNDATIVYFAPVERIQWYISFTVSENKIMEKPNHLRTNMILFLVLVLVAIAVVLYFVIRAQLLPIKMLSISTERIAKGDFNVTLPEIKSHDEIHNLRDSFEDMQHSLGHYVEELKATTASKASMESELKVASNIQMSMLPKVYPPFPDRDDIDIFGSLTPAKAIGGDLFDFYIRDEKLFFCIGDVSGKGVPASLVMAVTSALFRAVSSHEAQPDHIVSVLNESIASNNESNMFVTFFIGILDLPTGRLRYCNAGHNAPLILSNGQTCALDCDPNIPIGVMKDWKFKPQETMISPQTTIFLYTDGLTEAMNKDDNEFGYERVLDVATHLLEEGRHTPQNLIKTMTGAVHSFVGEAEQSDDLTMLGIQYTKPSHDVRYMHDITLPNDVQEIPRLAEFVDEVCEAVGFDMGTTMQINLAMEEAVVNVMNYAYPSGTYGEISITAQSNDIRLKFVIIDNGTPFDPTTHKEVDTTLSAEERGIGGLGIHLVREIMDSINYERINGQNILTLRKKF